MVILSEFTIFGSWVILYKAFLIYADFLF